MEKGGDVKGVFSRLARGIKAVEDSVRKESGRSEFLKGCRKNVKDISFHNLLFLIEGAVVETCSIVLQDTQQHQSEMTQVMVSISW